MSSENQQHRPLPLGNIGKSIADDWLVGTLVNEMFTLNATPTTKLRLKELKAAAKSLIEKRLLQNMEEGFGRHAESDLPGIEEDFKARLNHLEWQIGEAPTGDSSPHSS